MGQIFTYIGFGNMLPTEIWYIKQYDTICRRVEQWNNTTELQNPYSQQIGTSTEHTHTSYAQNHKNTTQKQQTTKAHKKETKTQT